MKESMRSTVIERLETLEGAVSLYYENLITGETIAYQADMPHVAASIIKLPIMIEAFRQFDCGAAQADEPVLVNPEDKMPGCGVLTHLHDGIEMPLSDLVSLMIIVSDNTATNLLIDRLGINAINRTVHDLGLKDTSLNRRMFDAESAAKGIQNYTTAADMGRLLYLLHQKEIISADASEKMIGILRNQKLRGKMPFYLSGTPIAHKTGEDDGITHDVGIIYAEQPFIACFMASNVNAPAVNRAIQEISAVLAEQERT